jgi:hypothetical protein
VAKQRKRVGAQHRLPKGDGEGELGGVGEGCVARRSDDGLWGGEGQAREKGGWVVDRRTVEQNPSR